MCKQDFFLFENELKIRIGYQDRKDDWINLNPSSEWLYTANPNGIDFRWIESDIPLFWKDKIVELDISPDYNDDLMNQYRDAYFLAMTRLHMNAFDIIYDENSPVPPEHWYKNHLKTKNG